MSSAIKPLKCIVCPYATNKIGNLIKHSRKHSGETRLSCKMCDYKSYYRGDLSKHVMRMHSSIRPFRCSSCAKSFCTNAELKYHIRTHSDKKPFKCSQCSFEACHKSSLKKHESKHKLSRGEAKCEISPAAFECDCGYKCSCRNHFGMHKKRHSGEKRLACPECQEAFMFKTELSKHLLERHPSTKLFVCTLCPYKTSRKGNLTVHSRTHTVEKPLKCVECKFACYYKGDLIKHVSRMHVKDRPFGCDRCSYRSVTKSELNRHLKVHAD